MKVFSPCNLLCFFPPLGLASAACLSDNCLRGLRATPTKASSFCATYTKTSNTATAIPTYGSFCSNSPSRVSSACSCVVTSSPTPTCVPTPIINGTNEGNGNFENYPPPEVALFNFQPPWAFKESDSIDAFGTYVVEPKSANYGGIVAYVLFPTAFPHASAWVFIKDESYLFASNIVSRIHRVYHLYGQEPNAIPGAFQRLQQFISYCNGTSYAFSLYARRISPDNQACRMSILTEYVGTIATFDASAFSDQFRKFGPVTLKPLRNSGVVTGRGEYQDTLSITVNCTGIAGRAVSDTIIQVDSVRLEPVA